MFFFFKQKTAYELRISDWSSDVCSSDLYLTAATYFATFYGQLAEQRLGREWVPPTVALLLIPADKRAAFEAKEIVQAVRLLGLLDQPRLQNFFNARLRQDARELDDRSEEHTYELQSLMRISYAVFCLKKKTTIQTTNHHDQITKTHI